jgi:hypothetical protein
MACGLDFLAGYWADVVTISQAGEEGELFFGWEFVNISENLTINIVPEKANLSDIMLALEGFKHDIGFFPTNTTFSFKYLPYRQHTAGGFFILFLFRCRTTPSCPTSK